MMQKPTSEKDTHWRDALLKDSWYPACITCPFSNKEAEGVLVSGLGLQFVDHEPSATLLGLPWELEAVCNSSL